MARPVSLVSSGGVPFVSVLDGPPATPVSDGSAPPVTLVTSGAPPICLVNDDGRYAVEVIPGLAALYDPSDLTSIYQSRTGGSTGAVDSVVGIMLDKSEMGGKTAANFIAGQSELVTNGTFDSATTGWTAGNATLSVDTNRLLVTGGVGGNGYAYQAITTVANRWYIATFDTTFGTESNALFRAGTSIGGAELVQITWTVAGAKAVLFMATGTTTYLRLGQNNPTTGLTLYFDNVSLKALPGYHALAPSDAARGILARVPASGRRNLLTYSEAFDNAAWSKSNCTVSANQIAAPDGATTADKIVSAASTTHQRVQQAATLSATTAYRVSAYFKAAEATWGFFRVAEDTAAMCYFNIGGGAVGTAESGWSSASITALSNGWYRCSATYTTVGTSYTFRFGMCDGDSSSNYTGNGTSGIYLWGTQVELGSTATAYQKVVSARDVTESGVADKYYLDLDGTDDWMNVFPTLNLGEQWWHVGGWQSDAATDAPFATSNRNQSALSQSGNWSWYTAEFGVGLMVSGTITSPHVLTVEQASASSLTGRINGTSGSAIDPYDGSTPTNGLALFSRNNNAFSVGLDGRFYGGAFGTGTLTSTDRALLERYVAGLTGVTL